mmetsp:Transcript_20495/g.66555  ORF Transcript_20495/g.66555 Transcript_20495/m.66555 type:complete len:550 (-) Transcript_20495:685-2334(-)
MNMCLIIACLICFTCCCDQKTHYFLKHLLFGRLASVRDVEEAERGLEFVNYEITLALELDDFADLERAHVGVAERLEGPRRFGVDEVLHLVLVLELLFGEEVVEPDERERDEVRRLGEPRELPLGALDAPFEVEIALELTALAVRLADKGVAPVHQRHLLAILDHGGVRGVEEQRRLARGGFRAGGRVLFVLRDGDHLRLRGPVGERELRHPLRQHRHVARAHRVNLLFVHGPKLVPLHQVGVAAGALREDEVAENFDAEAAALDALHGWEARIVPALHQVLVYEPLQLALREGGGHKVEPRVVPNVHVPEAHRILDKVVLRLAVAVLARSQCVRDALDGVHEWARAVVRRVHLELGTRAVMRVLDVAAKANRVAHARVRLLHVNLEPEAALLAALGALDHLGPQSEVVLHAVVAVLRLHAVHALLAHRERLRVVDVSLALLEQLFAHLENLVKVVGGVRYYIPLDAQRLDVLHDVRDEILILLCRVCVIESNDELAFVVPCKVLVQERSLGVPDVQKAGRLGRETCANLALLRTLEANIEGTAIRGRG